MPFLVDENVSPKVADSLRQRGYDARHVREVGLKGQSDEAMMAYALREGRCLITLDEDFADLRKHPPGTHRGIIRLRIRDARPAVVITVLERLLPQISESVLTQGGLVVSDGTTFRVRSARADR